MSGIDSDPDRSDTIVPVAFSDMADDGDAAGARRARRARRTAVVAAAVILFFAALSVVFVLPRYVGQGQPVQAEAPGAPAAAATAPATPANAAGEPEEQGALRRRNQEQLDALLGLIDQLETKNVTAWAADEFAAARSAIESGEQAYREQRYTDADDAYREALGTLEALDDRAASVVTEAVDRGTLALASRNSAGAKQAFEFALSVDPDHADAERGLERAGTLDQVLALVKEADGYEALGNLNGAIERYREALELDAQAPGAASAIARIEQKRLNENFASAMSDGLSAFDSSDNERAKAAFERALKLKPGASEASSALAQVENRILAERISANLNAAVEAERGERWADAAKSFRAAAALDRALDGAAASAARAERRAKLDAQLETVIARPERLSDDRVHQGSAGRARTRAGREQSRVPV